MLNEYECKKIDTIEKVEKGKMTRKEASIELDISLRQVDRLRKTYRENGKEGFAHKNRGKTNPNKKKKELIEELEQLYLDEFYDYNFEHFFEQIKDRYDISYPSLHNYFLNDDIISPIAHKKTIKLYNERMKSANQEKKCIVNGKKRNNGIKINYLGKSSPKKI